MGKSTTREEKDPVTLFNELQEELKAEATLAPERRNHQHKGATLKRFLEAGATEEEHEMWRRLVMLQEMEELHRRIFYGTNPHLKRIALMEASKEIHEHYYYFEEVDTEGKTQAQRDQEQATKHIAITRPRLELLAAERHLKELGLKTNTSEIFEKENCDTTSKANDKRPVLSYQELHDELSKELHSDAAIKKAAEESIKKALKAGKLPYKMVQCANGYQVVDLGTYRTTKGNPSKNRCTYQKI